MSNGATSIIESLGVYLPGKAVSTSDIMKGCKNRIPIPFESITGISSRRMAGESEFSIDLAEQSIIRCLENSKYSPDQIDILIAANISRCDGPNFRFTFEPSTAVRLKDRFGFTNALVFDLSNACAGMFTAIKIIDSLINTGIFNTGMVVSGEYITHLAKTAQKEIENYLDERLACLTLGDAGAALILEKSKTGYEGFHCVELNTLEEFSSLCIAKPSQESHGGGVMYTDMVNLSTAGFKYGNQHCVDTMQEYGWEVESIQHFILHQTSKRTLEGVERELKKRVPRAKRHYVNMVDNLAERGNTATTSHLLALHDKILCSNINDHDNVLFGVFGSGLTVGTALYKLDDLPSRLRKNSRNNPGENYKVVSSPRYDRIVIKDRLPRVRIAATGISASYDGQKSSLRMITQAANACIDNAGVRKDDIDLLINTGIYRDEFISEPAIATLVAKELKLHNAVTADRRNNFFAFDIMNGSLGFLNGCSIASAMINSGKYRRVLIVAAEIENNAVAGISGRREIKETASAVLLDLSSDRKTGFGDFMYQNYLGNLDALSSHVAQQNGKTFLVFDRSTTLMGRYLECVLETFEDFLHVTNLELSQIKVIIPPQISSEFINAFRSNLSDGASTVVDATCSNMDLFTSSLPIAFEKVRAERLANPGDIGVILHASSGIQIGATVYYF